MIMDIVSTVAVITGFQLVFLSVFLLTYKKGRRSSNLILSAFLASNALYILHYLLYRSGAAVYAEYPPLSKIGSSTYFLLGPLIFLYTKSLCYRDFKIRKNDAVHLLPLLLLIGTPFLFHYFIQPSSPPENTASMYRSFSTIWNLIEHGLIFGYICFTIFILKRYQKELRDHYSSIQKINLAWLLLILSAFLLMWFVDILVFFLPLLGIPVSSIAKELTVLSLLINLAFAMALVFKGLKQPDIFTGIESALKYGNQRLSREETGRYTESLRQYMQREKPYLDPSLTLKELSEKLDIPPRHLSQVINNSLGRNFFDMVSSYRIEETKRMFTDPSHQNKTILEILYDAGFNSKSSFNSLFKKKTGMTPSEYRKQRSSIPV